MDNVMDDGALLGWPRQYGDITTSLHGLPSLPQLRDHLGVMQLNTKKRLTTRFGLVTDDQEGLHAVADERGYTRLISGVEFCIQGIYRGQVREHDRCIPSLGRLKTLDAQLLALCRNLAFEDAIADHPFVRLAEQETFLGKPLFVDKKGLAQHYGLPTHMLDVTCNFDVASFFATCTWNTGRRRYEPTTDNRHKPSRRYLSAQSSVLKCWHASDHRLAAIDTS
jgi:hypothetical protein